MRMFAKKKLKSLRFDQDMIFSVTTQTFLNLFEISEIFNLGPSYFGFYKGLYLLIRWYHKNQKKSTITNNSVSRNQYAGQNRFYVL